MNKREIINCYKLHYSIYNENYNKLDPAIKPLVKYLRQLGFITYASCSSHLRNYEGKPVNCAQAYVAFFYEDKDLEKLNQLMKHQFPENKNYMIKFTPYWNENKVCFDIFFFTKKNRILYLKEIYQSLGIEITQKLRLEKSRECYIDTKNPHFTIFKNQKRV